MCVNMYNSMFLYQLYPQWFIWVSIKNVLQVHTTLNKSACILFWIDNVSIIFQYLSIHIDQMEIVYTVPTKLAMCAEVCYYSSKGFSERLYVRNTCTYNGIFITILIWIQTSFLVLYYQESKWTLSILIWFQIYLDRFFFHCLDCPAGYFGNNCTDKCIHPTFGILCSEICDCSDCHHIIGCISNAVNTGNVKVVCWSVFLDILITIFCHTCMKSRPMTYNLSLFTCVKIQKWFFKCTRSL